MPFQTGYILANRYRIVKLLGQGGFGAVYRAWDTNLNRACAVKENLTTSPGARRQFNREASLLANCSHPNLPRVTDHFFVPDQGQYLVMDFVEGQDLQDMLDNRQAPLPEAQVLTWVRQICDALSYLHAQSPPIIHRDIKPANIKITPEGKAMLVDFGIAKVFDAHLQTTVGARAVTPGYSPTEQYGQGKTDARSDVYALGATMYTLLTGEVPPESIQRNLGTQLLPPRAFNPSISSACEGALLKAMAMLPEERYGSTADFKADLLQPVYPAQVMRAEARPLAMPGHHAPQETTVAKRPRSPIPWLWIGIFGGLALLALVILSTMAGFFFGGTGGEGNTDETNTALALINERTQTGAATETSTHTPVTAPSDTPTTALLPETSTDTFLPAITQTPSATPTPALQPAIVEPYCSMFDQSPVYVEQHQPITLWWRWDAATAQFVQDHIEAAIYRILLDGIQINSDRMSEIEYLPGEQFYRVSWFADIAPLTPGQHRAERFLSWTRRISDGWDTFGPGGKIETEYHYCDIIVQ